MLVYVRRKIIHLILITFAVTALSFLFINLLPGDVADTIAGGSDNTEVDLAAVQAIREDLGLDRPIVVRYMAWIGGALRGELGKSYQTGELVSDAIALRLPVTLQLLLTAQLLALIFAIPAGVIAAYRAGRVADQVITTLTFVFLAAPSFIIAIVLAFLFAVILHWFPATGYIPFTEDLFGNLRTFTLPAVTLALIEWPILSRVLREGERAERYLHSVQTCVEAIVIHAHYHRRRSTRQSDQWRSHCREHLRASRDRVVVGHLVQGIVALTAVAYVTINLAVDLLYGALDPRVVR